MEYSDGSKNGNAPITDKVRYNNNLTTIKEIIREKQAERERETREALNKFAEAAQQRGEGKFDIKMLYTEYLIKDFQEKLKRDNFNKYKITKFVPVPTQGDRIIYADVELEHEENRLPVKISYTGPTASPSTMPGGAIKLLEEVGRETRNRNIIITSTIRTPEQQGQEMYNNFIKTSYADQMEMYGAPGRKVVEKCKQMIDNKSSKDETIKAMIKLIYELGPITVSSHCNTAPKAFDVAISKLENPNDFYNAMKKRGISILDERPNDINCYHIVL